MAEIQAQPDYPRGLTFEHVWAALMEDREQLNETKRIVQENARIIGKLGNRMGEVIEHMVAPNLRQKFRDLGYDFPSASHNSDVSDRANNIHLEIDIKLENGDKAMLVEVKTKPTTEDVQDHIVRMKKMRKYADLHGDKRVFLGAVAGVVMTNNVKEYVLKQGLFVIEPSGDTFSITPPDGQPREW